MTKKRKPTQGAGGGRARSAIGDYAEMSVEAQPKRRSASTEAALDELPNAAVAALDDLIAANEEEDHGDGESLTAPAPLVEPEDLDLEEPPPPPKRMATNAVMDDELVEETVLPELPALMFAIHEESAHIAAAQVAITSAGHAVAIVASGRDGASRIADAVRAGDVDAVLVSLPGGEEVIDAALALEPRRPVVIASVADTGVQAVTRATAAGADLATTKPHDVDRVAPLLLAAARLFAERNAALNVRGSEQVLRARLDEISDPDSHGFETFEMFQRVLEREIKRAKRYEYPLAVALFAVEIAPPPPPPGIRGILRARCGNALINTIRDIDLATQLDQERFLVLLPYTDLQGAAMLGRRVIAAVADLDPVMSAGRIFPARVVGAVAGHREGQPLSFSRLMKDATRALEQARRDGAELAVQP